MRDREKIADALNATEISVELEKADIYKFADALIAEGYGNVADWKRRAEVAERKYNISLQLLNSIVHLGKERFDKEITQQAERELEDERK